MFSYFSLMPSVFPPFFCCVFFFPCDDPLLTKKTKNEHKKHTKQSDNLRMQVYDVLSKSPTLGTLHLEKPKEISKLLRLKMVRGSRPFEACFVQRFDIQSEYC